MQNNKTEAATSAAYYQPKACLTAGNFRPKGKDHCGDLRAIRYMRETQKEIEKGLAYFWARRGRRTVPQE